MDKFDVLKRYFGHESFRQGQERLIEDLLAGHDIVCIMPTGTGKSLCYQIPALLFSGMTIAISAPAASLEEQVEALTQKGIGAACLNSTLSASQYDKVLEDAASGLYKILYVAPERLMTKGFLALSQTAPISLVAVDDAQCISQWGNCYKPSYLKIAGFIHQLPTRPVVAAFSSIATKRVREDIVHGLQLVDPLIRVEGFDRDNLRFAVMRPKDKAAALLAVLRQRKDKNGIVYCNTKKTVDDLVNLLKKNEYNAVRYYAELTDEERNENREAFLNDRVPIMVATNAFGQGIDKSNVSFVVHFDMPKDVESYFAGACLAGRNGQAADCLLLFNAKDVATQEAAINNLQKLENIDKKTMEALQLRNQEKLDQMVSYCKMKGCLSKYILHYLGESTPGDCGKCSNCMDRLTAEQIARPLKAQAVEAGQVAVATDLMGRLKNLRSSIAKRQGVPPLIIFSDDSLADMCKRLPRTDKEFLQIAGTGDFRGKHYGQAFLNVINAYRQEQKQAHA
jgi:ATP-dependent DNA helicase RecQ